MTEADTVRDARDYMERFDRFAREEGSSGPGKLQTAWDHLTSLCDLADRLVAEREKEIATEAKWWRRWRTRPSSASATRATTRIAYIDPAEWCETCKRKRAAALDAMGGHQ